MIVRIINVYVIPEQIDAFRAATLKNQQSSLEEPGVLRFDVLQDQADPGIFVLYEVYRSDEATLAHKETNHYSEWKETVEPMMARARERRDLSVIGPTEEARWKS